MTHQRKYVCEIGEEKGLETRVLVEDEGGQRAFFKVELLTSIREVCEKTKLVFGEWQLPAIVLSPDGEQDPHHIEAARATMLVWAMETSVRTVIEPLSDIKSLPPQYEARPQYSKQDWFPILHWEFFQTVLHGLKERVSAEWRGPRPFETPADRG